jgi:hypothetical protein
MGERGLFTLRCVYADKPSDILVFQQQQQQPQGAAAAGTAAGAFQVLETDFVRSLPAHVTESLSQLRSIPAFAASVLFHLFEKHTRTAPAAAAAPQLPPPASSSSTNVPSMFRRN